MRTLIVPQRHFRLGIVLGCCITLGAVCFGQGKTGEGKKATKDNVESVWRLQAQSVSDQLGLTKDQSEKLTVAYLAARAAHRQSVKELREETDKDKSRVALQGAIEKDREGFLSSLKGSVDSNALAKIATTLGSFNSRWDGYAATLVDLKLDNTAMKSAMGFLIKYVTDYEQASKKSLETFNRRPNSRQFKAKLDADLAGILTAEQAAEWNRATTMSDGKDKGARSEKK